MKSSFYFGSFSLAAAILAVVSLQVEAGPKNGVNNGNAKAASVSSTNAKKVVYSSNANSSSGGNGGANAKKVVNGGKAKTVAGNGGGNASVFPIRGGSSKNNNETQDAIARAAAELKSIQKAIKERQQAIDLMLGELQATQPGKRPSPFQLETQLQTNGYSAGFARKKD